MGLDAAAGWLGDGIRCCGGLARHVWVDMWRVCALTASTIANCHLMFYCSNTLTNTLTNAWYGYMCSCMYVRTFVP